MAVRKTKTASRAARGGRGKKTSAPAKGKTYSWAILIWLAFAIFILGFFIFNREAIISGIQTIKKEYSSHKKPADEKPEPPLTTGPDTAPVSVQQPAAPPPVQTPQPAPRPAPPPAPPSAVTPVSPQQTPQSTTAPATPKPVQTTPPPAAAPAAPRPVEQRERVLYFTQVDRDGTILRVKANRKLPVSDSPMKDVIQALITGPSSEEKNRGLISLVPPAAKILSATVRGDTAYISFSEDFQYNTYGVEGYAGQVRQVVFTATEFPNVKSVQILIEGRRVDYLGEGVWIGSPLSRESL